MMLGRGLLTLVLVPWIVVVGCSDSESVCGKAAEQACPECLDGVVTCSFDGVEVTEPSCDGCQARTGLYDELCEAGSTATVSEVDEGMVCEEVAETGA